MILASSREKKHRSKRLPPSITQPGSQTLATLHWSDRPRWSTWRPCGQHPAGTHHALTMTCCRSICLVCSKISNTWIPCVFFSGAVPLFFRMMIFPIYKNPTKVPAKICSFRKKKGCHVSIGNNLQNGITVGTFACCSAWCASLGLAAWKRSRKHP